MVPKVLNDNAVDHVTSLNDSKFTISRGTCFLFFFIAFSMKERCNILLICHRPKLGI